MIDADSASLRRALEGIDRQGPCPNEPRQSKLRQDCSLEGSYNLADGLLNIVQGVGFVPEGTYRAVRFSAPSGVGILLYGEHVQANAYESAVF